jgi:hypothetical protein
MNSIIAESWNLGQQHLGAGRYLSARRYLEIAERAAWEARDARSLARLYLPLLETRRQIRYLAVEGTILIGDGDPTRERRLLAGFLRSSLGTAIFASAAADRLAARVLDHARVTGRPFEALYRRGNALNAFAAPWSADAIACRITSDPGVIVEPAAPDRLIAIFPPPGLHVAGSAAQAQARESLLIVWEALGLRWQSRHHADAGPWGELAWLRAALTVDPASEPISMRLMALAEGIARNAGT